MLLYTTKYRYKNTIAHTIPFYFTLSCVFRFSSSNSITMYITTDELISPPQLAPTTTTTTAQNLKATENSPPKKSLEEEEGGRKEGRKQKAKY